MAEFLTTITTFFTQSMTWVGEALGVVTDSPALTVMVLAMPIVGFVVGLFNRLLRA